MAEGNNIAGGPDGPPVARPGAGEAVKSGLRKLFGGRPNRGEPPLAEEQRLFGDLVRAQVRQDDLESAQEAEKARQIRAAKQDALKKRFDEEDKASAQAAEAARQARLARIRERIAGLDQANTR